MPLSPPPLRSLGSYSREPHAYNWTFRCSQLVTTAESLESVAQDAGVMVLTPIDDSANAWLGSKVIMRPYGFVRQLDRSSFSHYRSQEVHSQYHG